MKHLLGLTMCQASSGIHHGLSHLRLTTNLSQLGPLRSRWNWEYKWFIGGQCLWKTKGGKGRIGQGMFRPQCRSDAYEREQAGRGEPQTAPAVWPGLGHQQLRSNVLPIRGVSSWAEMTMPRPHWAQWLAGGYSRRSQPCFKICGGY